MQYWLKNHCFKHSSHTNCISNSAILHNNYISLLSDLCACVHVKKKWHRKGSHSSSVSSLNRLVRLQTWKKAMGWCTAQWENLLFCVKTIMKESHNLHKPMLHFKRKKGFFNPPLVTIVVSQCLLCIVSKKMCTHLFSISIYYRSLEGNPLDLYRGQFSQFQEARGSRNATSVCVQLAALLQLHALAFLPLLASCK